MVELTKTIYDSTLNKKMQYLTTKINGNALTYNPDSHVKINVTLSDKEFDIFPFFCDELRNSPSLQHADAKPKVTFISGSANQIVEYSFIIDDEYFGG